MADPPHQPPRGAGRADAVERGAHLLRRVVAGFDEHTVAELAATERVTVHDVKAVEYLLKERLGAAGRLSARTPCCRP